MAMDFQVQYNNCLNFKFKSTLLTYLNRLLSARINCAYMTMTLAVPVNHKSNKLWHIMSNKILP